MEWSRFPFTDAFSTVRMFEYRENVDGSAPAQIWE